MIFGDSSGARLRSRYFSFTAFSKIWLANKWIVKNQNDEHGSCFCKGNLNRNSRAMNQKNNIELTDEERQHLEILTSFGIASARRVN